MLNESKDLFWLALSIAIMLLGVFGAWAIFYVAMILRDVQKITKSVRKKMDLIDQILNIVKNKVETTASYLPPLIEAGGKLMEAFKEKKKAKKKK